MAGRPRAQIGWATIRLGTLALGIVVVGNVGSAAWLPAHPRVPEIDARNWTYQLQDYDLRQIRESRFDLIVMDYSSTGGADGEFTAEQIRALRQDGPCGDRTVLAYMSIGEAEDYRFYWDPSWVDANGDPKASAPAYLGPTNPAWEGNYKVRYWLKAWQRVIYGTAQGTGKSYLDRILDAGFDGVYLDIVDGFEYWGPRELDGTDERRKAPADMVRFIKRLARYARKTRGRPGFLVVPQNGAGIISADSYPDAADADKEAARQRRRYFRVVSGIGAEDLFYVGGRDENNSLHPQNYRMKFLDQFAGAGKTVLSIDYLTRPNLIEGFWQRATARGYLPYATVRDLDQLTIPAGHAPTCS